MMKLVVKGKLVDMDENELARRFSPNTLGIDRLEILKALAEQPKQVPAIMKALNLGESRESSDYGRVRYYLNKLHEKGVVGRHKVNAKTVLWYLTEKGLATLEKREA